MSDLILLSKIAQSCQYEVILMIFIVDGKNKVVVFTTWWLLQLYHFKACRSQYYYKCGGK